MKIIFGLLLAILAISLSVLAVIFVIPRVILICQRLSVLASVAKRANGKLKLSMGYVFAFAHEEMRVWSVRHVWFIAVFQILALSLFLLMVVGESSLWGLVFALLVYPFVVCALSLSLLWRLPIVKALWGDVSCKIIIFGSQIIGVYLAKGYANFWVSKLFSVDAANVPMAHAAATAFTMLVGISILLLPVIIFFQALLVLNADAPNFREKKEIWERSPVEWNFSSSRKLRSGAHKIYWRRRIGALLATGTTLFACAMAFHACHALTETRVANNFLSAVVFEMDAAPAVRCALSDDIDLYDAQRTDPDLKALFLSTTQERALLVRRMDHMYEPVVLRILNSKRDFESVLSVGRVVQCYKS